MDEPNKVLPIFSRLISIAYRQGYGGLSKGSIEEIKTRLRFPTLPAAHHSYSFKPKPYIPNLVIYPANIKTSSEILIYFRASAYVGGEITYGHARCLELQELLGLTIISIDYPVLPEYAFPDCFTRSLDAVEWILSESEFKKDKAILWGESCGATIAFTVAQSLAPHFQARLSQLVLFYPIVDNLTDYPSQTQYGSGFLFDGNFRQWLYAFFGQEGPIRAHPYVSPLLQPLSLGLPPTYIVAAECDSTRDEAHALYTKMQATGLKVELITLLKAIHGFLLFEQWAYPARWAFLWAVEKLKKRI